MSGIQILKKHYIFEQESMAAEVFTAAQKNEQVVEMTIYVRWDNGSTPVGEIRLQANTEPPGKPENWEDLTLDSAANVAGNSGNLEITVDKPLSDWRLRYIPSSGDGELWATVEGRSRG